jgi:phosphohistidine phosphatase
MRIYLVQHAEAVPKHADPDRPLTEAGRRNAERVAAFLAKANVRPVRIIHSGKTRALETAKILAMALGKKLKVEAMAGLNPDDPPDKLSRRIDELGDETLIVGHVPFLPRLVSLLVADDEGYGLVRYQPGSIVCLEQDEAGAWAIAWMLQPELLAAGLRGPGTRRGIG